MLSVTPRAQEMIREALKSYGSPTAAVWVAVMRGPHGCVHGWKFAIDRKDPKNTEIQVEDVRIVVEPDLVSILAGASIDYREDAIGIGFTIEAPNTPPPMHEQGGGCHH